MIKPISVEYFIVVIKRLPQSAQYEVIFSTSFYIAPFLFDLIKCSI